MSDDRVNGNHADSGKRERWNSSLANLIAIAAVIVSIFVFVQSEEQDRIEDENRIIEEYIYGVSTNLEDTWFFYCHVKDRFPEFENSHLGMIDLYWVLDRYYRHAKLPDHDGTDSSVRWLEDPFRSIRTVDGGERTYNYMLSDYHYLGDVLYRMTNLNRETAELMAKYAPHVRTDDFRDVSIRYREHVRLVNLQWSAAQYSETIPDDPSDFPIDLYEKLEAELLEWDSDSRLFPINHAAQSDTCPTPISADR